MRMSLLTAGLLLMAMMGAGCVVIDVEEVQPRASSNVEPMETTAQEIDAIGRLGFEDARFRGFKNVAERPGLSDAIQVHLIEAVFEKLGFENSRVDVLLTLVANPCFSSAGEAALLERIDRLGFENDKQRVLAAINERKS